MEVWCDGIISRNSINWGKDFLETTIKIKIKGIKIDMKHKIHTDPVKAGSNTSIVEYM